MAQGCGPAEFEKGGGGGAHDAQARVMTPNTSQIVAPPWPAK